MLDLRRAFEQAGFSNVMSVAHRFRYIGDCKASSRFVSNMFSA